MLTGTGDFWSTAPRETPRTTSVVGRQEVLSPHGQSSSSNWDLDRFSVFVEDGANDWTENEIFFGAAHTQLA